MNVGRKCMFLNVSFYRDILTMLTALYFGVFLNKLEPWQTVYIMQQ